MIIRVGKMNEDQQLFLDIVSEVYTDSIDAVGMPELREDGAIVGQFQDDTKVLEAALYPDRSENDIEIRILNLNDIEGEDVD